MLPRDALEIQSIIPSRCKSKEDMVRIIFRSLKIITRRRNKQHVPDTSCWWEVDGPLFPGGFPKRSRAMHRIRDRGRAFPCLPWGTGERIRPAGQRNLWVGPCLLSYHRIRRQSDRCECCRHLCQFLLLLRGMRQGFPRVLRKPSGLFAWHKGYIRDCSLHFSKR